MTLFPPLQKYCQQMASQFDNIDSERSEELKSLAAFIQEQVDHDLPANIVAICTHNSRRSHLAQVWLAIAAHFYSIPKVYTYSGGTEATAVYPTLLQTLRQQGVHIQAPIETTENPVHKASWTDGQLPNGLFSRRYDHETNPQQGFCALMVCSQADVECPIVHGCDSRIALPYEDPKAYDRTPLELDKYLERSEQICREMLYALSLVTPLNG